ncbi:hypothetical protein PG985_012780 [Apiospora marii]|uniref:BTB domain-containing protein n=1 Tax=Apiospora marii TaxID=335849 RepID=A0ABR1RCQ7_9PEZI
METPIILPEDQDFLANKNLLCRSKEYPGFLHVHKAVLGPGSLREYESEPAATRQRPLVLVPELFESSACLRYLGFKTATAEKVWNRWEQSDPDRKSYYSAKDDAIAHITSTDGDKDTYSLEDSEWHELLTRIGVNNDFRRNLMDPRYKAIRMLKTCKQWVEYFFRHRCDTLIEIHKFSRERHVQPPHVMDTVGRGPETSVWSLQLAIPGFVTLWTGESYNRTRGRALDEADWKVNGWRNLKSSGHHWWTTKGLSFTTQRDLALHSIGWHKKNDRNAGFFLVQVQVPRETIRNITDDEREVYLRCSEGYLQDTTIFCRRPQDGGGEFDHGPLEATTATRSSTLESGTVADEADERVDTRETRGPSPNISRHLYPNSYSVNESALDRHVVAHIDSNDFFEINRMWDIEDKIYA